MTTPPQAIITRTGDLLVLPVPAVLVDTRVAGFDIAASVGTAGPATLGPLLAKLRCALEPAASSGDPARIPGRLELARSETPGIAYHRTDRPLAPLTSSAFSPLLAPTRVYRPGGDTDTAAPGTPSGDARAGRRLGDVGVGEAAAPSPGRAGLVRPLLPPTSPAGLS